MEDECPPPFSSVNKERGNVVFRFECVMMSGEFTSPNFVRLMNSISIFTTPEDEYLPALE